MIGGGFRGFVSVSLFVSLVVSVRIENIPDGEPPMIIDQFKDELAYVPDQPLILNCVATGSPRPKYRWYVNSKPYPDDAERDNGTLIVTRSKLEKGEGYLQCAAFNQLGTALSVVSYVKPAVLNSFPTVTNVTVWKPTIGQPFNLTCHPPTSYPAGTIYWGQATENSKLKPIDNTARVSLDYHGNMHFAHVLQEDSLNNRNYVCYVSNDFLKTLVQGNDQRVEPQKIQQSLRYIPPALMWSSNTSVIALSGQRLAMKCIFSGFPTPTVEWKLDGEVLATEGVRNESFGQEVIIDSVTPEHEGNYSCIGRNSEAHQSATVTFTVTVQSRPLWLQRPESLTVTPGSSVQFFCKAKGHPTPSTHWSVNGQPIEDYMKKRNESSADMTSHLHVTSEQITLDNVTVADNLVLQCNCTNKHGWVFTNAFLAVREQINGTDAVTTANANTVLPILLVLLVILILLTVLVFYGYKRYSNKAVVYQVYEKEKRFGALPLRCDPDYEELGDTINGKTPKIFPRITDTGDSTASLQEPDFSSSDALLQPYAEMALGVSGTNSSDNEIYEPFSATSISAGDRASAASTGTAAAEVEVMHLYTAVLKKSERDKVNQGVFNPLSNL